MPAAQRFVVLAAFNNEAVLDKNTGLVWEKSPSILEIANAEWFVARTLCLNSVTGGQKGWRLPSIPELNSLIDPSAPFPDPKLPPGHPFLNVLGLFFWSATRSAEFPENAWLVDFTKGLTLSLEKIFPARTWCVRGGMNADQY